MKKILLKKFKREKEQLPNRITNETVAEHREKILAGGRKFKYPIQYAKHKLVFNAILITLGAIILFAAVVWWQLYLVQSSNSFMYRVTRVLPLPVASVNGEPTLYKDYLVQYRSSEFYLNKYGEIKLSSANGKRQLDYIKRQALDMAEQVAYARQQARALGVSVANKDVVDFIDQERNTANGRVSQETYDSSIKMLYDQSADDYRLTVENGILRNRVAFAVDTNAKKQVEAAAPLVTSTKGDFAAVAKQLAKLPGAKISVGQTGLINNTTKFGGLRASEVADLSVGKVSKALRSTTDDGYYFVKVIDKTDTQVNFAYLHVPLTKFMNDFTQLKSEKKINEYITVADNLSQQTN